MPTKFTKTFIDSIVSTAKDQLVWDSGIAGFGLKTTPTGRKVFVLQHHRSGRKTPARRYTIGAYGQLTLDQARKEAIRLNGKIASGVDPAETRKAQARAAVSLRQFSERYMSEYAVPHKKTSSVQEDRRNLDNHILPALGSKALGKITRGDISKLHHALRKTPIAANRVIALFVTMMNLAERWELRPDGSNPCRHIQRYKEVARERFLSGEELGRLGKVLAQVEGEKTHGPFIIALFRLLIFTGSRLSEVRLLKWEYVDLKERRLNLPDSKTGKKVITLNAPAVAVLDQLPRIEGNPYVCCGNRAGRPLRTVHNAWRHIRGLAKLDDVRIHDLRHSFASVAAGSGMGLPIIGSLLGHRQAETTKRYSHLHQDPLREASEVIAQRIKDAMEPEGVKADVVPLKTQRRGGGGQG